MPPKMQAEISLQRSRQSSTPFREKLRDWTERSQQRNSSREV